MYDLYNELPFSIIILNSYKLNVDYINNKFIKIFNLSNKILGTSINDINIFEPIRNILNTCSKSKCNKKLKKVNILDNRYFDLMIKCKDDKLEIFMYEVTEYIKKEMKIKSDGERFLSIWSEMKTKCDIIQELRTKEKTYLSYLKDVVNNISEGLIVLNKFGELDFCNKAALNITGLSIKQLSNYKAVFREGGVCIDGHNYGEKEIEQLLSNYLYEQKPINGLVVRLKSSDNNFKYIELNCNPIKNKDNMLFNTVITIKDITEVKEHEFKLREQTKFINDVVDTIDVPIAVLDYPNLNYKLINEKYKSILDLIKYNKNNNLEKNLLPSEIDILKNLEEEKIKEYIYAPLSVKNVDGNQRHFKVKFSSQLDSNDKVSKVFIHALDITDEIRRNNELEEISRMKDEFFNVISHELRTPLTIIHASLQLANDIYKNEITDNLNKILSKIDQNCRILLKLINNILDISKAEAGFLQANYSCFDIVYLTESLVSSVNLYAKSRGIELIFDTSEEEASVMLDRDKYEKIVLNLLSNAIKFTPANKRILVSTVFEKDFFEIKVKDEGIGIPEDKLEKIFDRFVQVNNIFSRNSSGTGLGLALVKKLVDLMNGEIKVLSKIGEGTEFSIRFNNEIIKNHNINNLNELDSNSNNVIIEFSELN